MGGEWDGLVCRDGDAVQRGEESGCVVNSEALVGNNVFLVLIVEVLEIRHGDILFIFLFLLIAVLLGRSLLLSCQLCDFALLECISLWLANNLFLEFD